MVDDPHGGRRTDHTKLNIWLTFAGTVVAALIAGLFTLLATRSSDPEPKAQDPQQPQQPATTGTKAPTAAATTKAAEGWSGKIAVQNSAVELDLTPPRVVDNADFGGDVNVRFGSSGRIAVTKTAFGNSAFARWEGSGTPQLEDCRQAAITETEVDKLTTGAVLCVRTTEGRFARLTLKKVAGGLPGTATFDAIVWTD
ncbi:hypothetical protein [Actinoplanes palleronii]|uniref:Serine/threonine protein kinase n=1 Tax=Actinoplanes palleronii TaxID=113570 RepID=A0ABQ4BH18_9ACTN|nr:hypothetical protein [Actinoplanes palleronii]GIE69980.1 hypothetical protein Apa02nite_060880 [Actinoplanes palleronii]